jgi:hypothetical protein
VNKVGPYNNPQETYNYYYLPFCKPFADGKAEHSWGGLGEVLQGNELINSQIDIRFEGAVMHGSYAQSSILLVALSLDGHVCGWVGGVRHIKIG